MTRTRICFATPGVQPLLAGNPAVYGGTELRALTFLRGLAARPEWQVSLIVFAAGGTATPGIEIIPDRYNAGRRSLIERLAGRLRRGGGGDGKPSVAAGEAAAWRHADAALYLAFGVGDYTAKLAAWCRHNGRRLAIVAGSDGDFDAHYQPGDRGHNPYGSQNRLCRYAIDRADAIICQTATQAELLMARFGRGGIVVRNPVELAEPLIGSRRHVLWLGKTDRVKRPELCRDLASLCPEIPFVLVANPTDPARFRALADGAPANLETRELVARSDLDRLMADSFCLVNTSAFEGFPNAFLDAARQGVPVLSLSVDPDDVLARSGGGIAANGDIGRLAGAVRQLYAAPAEARLMGGSWRAYVAAHHEAGAQIAAFDAALRRILLDQSSRTVSPSPALRERAERWEDEGLQTATGGRPLAPTLSPAVGEGAGADGSRST